MLNKNYECLTKKLQIMKKVILSLLVIIAATTIINSQSYTKHLGGKNVRCLEKDNNGNIWIGTYYSGVYKYDGSTFTNYFDGNAIWDIHKKTKFRLLKTSA